MNDTIPLSNLGNGCCAMVMQLNSEGLTRRRMLDLGLVPGTKVEAIRRSPAGDPIAFNIRGTVIAFRKEEADKIIVFKL